MRSDNGPGPEEKLQLFREVLKGFVGFVESLMGEYVVDMFSSRRS